MGSVPKTYRADGKVPTVAVGTSYTDGQIDPCRRFLAVSTLTGSRSFFCMKVFQ
jgi:hypothetical protein